MTGAAKGHYRKATGAPMTTENNRYQPSEAALPAWKPSDLEAAAFPHLDMTCWCGACDQRAVDLLPEGDIRRIGRRMNLCPTCGNKRCPRSWDHLYACTGSNEPGQTPTLAKQAGASSDD